MPHFNLSRSEVDADLGLNLRLRMQEFLRTLYYSMRTRSQRSKNFINSAPLGPNVAETGQGLMCLLRQEELLAGTLHDAKVQH
jgi:hypothetical protein